MENVCKKHGEQFMWQGVFDDNSIKVEFEDSGLENDIIENIMDAPGLVKFGLAGNGFYSYFETSTGVFNLFGDDISISLKTADVNDIMESNVIRNKVIMFRTAESILHPSGGQTDGSVFKYAFGYKLENEHCYIRAIMSIDMYEGIKLEFSITGKSNIPTDIVISVNGNVTLTKEIGLIKDVRQEIIIPMQNK